jgi:hypothetical protein
MPIIYLEISITIQSKIGIGILKMLKEEESISQDDDSNSNCLPAAILKLRIRNTTKYLNWRIAIKIIILLSS